MSKAGASGSRDSSAAAAAAAEGDEEPDGLLRMRQLAAASGVSAGTIKHYLREGLLPEPVRTSRNMAYYPPEFVERIKLIKQLQEERFLPLRVIKEMLDGGAGEADGSERLRAMVELEDRIVERAQARGSGATLSRAAAREQLELPGEVLDRLEELEVVTPRSGSYQAEDVRILEAISRMRTGGYSDELGFTVYDALLYQEAIEGLVEREVSTFVERLVGEVPTEKALELIENAEEPLRDLIAAMRSKLLFRELARKRSSRDG